VLTDPIPHRWPIFRRGPHVHQIALPGFWLGMRFLGLAWSGRSEQSSQVSEADTARNRGLSFRGAYFTPITILGVSRDGWCDAKNRSSNQDKRVPWRGSGVICTIRLLRKNSGGKLRRQIPIHNFPLDCPVTRQIGHLETNHV